MRILEAAYRVVEAHGVSALTFEAVSEAAEISRGGLVYHFATKDELVKGLHEYLAARWENELEAALGRAPEEASEDERVAAYAQVSVRSASGTDLLMMIEAARHEELLPVYSSVAQRWLPSTEVDPADEVAVDRLIAALAADGLWASEAVGVLRVPAHLRTALADRISRMITREPPVSDA